MIQAITIQESVRLIDLERKIENGLQTFVEVGEALMEIRDSRLYRVEHSTFEDYCREKWKFTKTQANRLIGAADVAKNLAPIGVIPASESQARPLTKLPAEQQPAAWEKAVEKAGGEQPTAKQVEEAVVEVLAPEAKSQTKERDVRSDGLMYATLAISQLAKISKGDTQRSDAFKKVISWIEAH